MQRIVISCLQFFLPLHISSPLPANNQDGYALQLIHNKVHCCIHLRSSIDQRMISTHMLMPASRAGSCNATA